ARLEDGRLQDRLRERLAHAVRVEVAEHLLERERVHLREREDEAFLGRGGLQLEVEALAELLAQREPPRAQDAAAEGRVQPDSSKKRSRAMTSWVGTTPSARFAWSKYAAICAAAERDRR